MRRGASWTAAYRRQLTVAAVARPVRGGVGAPGVLAAERSWWLVAQTASARSSVQPVSGGRASSPWSTRPAGTPRRRSPVSSRRCPPIRSRRPGSGCPAVRCPVTWGWSSRGPAVGRLLSSCPLSSCPVSIRAVSSRLVSALVGPDASVSSHSGGGGGDQVKVATGTGGGPCGCRAIDGSTTVAEAGTRAPLPTSRWPVGGRWRTRRRRGGCGPRRPRLPAERPGRLGRRAERRSRAAALWPRRGLRREVTAPAAWPASSAGCATTVGGRRRAGRPGGRPRRGQGRCRRGWACGPSAAQAGSECSQLAAGSALTCDDGWWACQDLNLGPHPYQGCALTA